MNVDQDVKEMIVEATEGTITMDKVDSVGDNLEALGWSSLIQVRFIVKLEELYDIEIDVELIEELGLLKSKSSLVQYLTDELAAKAIA